MGNCFKALPDGVTREEVLAAEALEDLHTTMQQREAEIAALRREQRSVAINMNAQLQTVGRKFPDMNQLDETDVDVITLLETIEVNDNINRRIHIAFAVRKKLATLAAEMEKVRNNAQMVKVVKRLEQNLHRMGKSAPEAMELVGDRVDEFMQDNTEMAQVLDIEPVEASTTAMDKLKMLLKKGGSNSSASLELANPSGDRLPMLPTSARNQDSADEDLDIVYNAAGPSGTAGVRNSLLSSLADQLREPQVVSMI
jgi:hypothetical protein